MQKTNIQYLTHTWNPITMRCTKVSPACDNCWHLAKANMLAKNPMIHPDRQAIYAGNSLPVIKMKELEAPSKRKKPAIIGVQFMGDLFHENIDFIEHVDPVFAEMKNAPQHTFVVLTKRPERALEYHNYQDFENMGHDFETGKKDCSNWEWPKNIWIGVTVENQEQAEKRIPVLLEIPAAVRFLSIEPMLDPIDFNALSDQQFNLNALTGLRENLFGAVVTRFYGSKIHWVILGGETGPGSRKIHLDWVRSIRDQCQSAEIPFFFKQWGEYGVNGYLDDNLKLIPGSEWMDRMGKKMAGCILDGREWKEYPKGGF